MSVMLVACCEDDKLYHVIKLLRHSFAHAPFLRKKSRQRKIAVDCNEALLRRAVPRINWGTGIRGLMRSVATLPQGNQELSVVRDKVGRPPGELGVSKSMECDIFLSVL